MKIRSFDEFDDHWAHERGIEEPEEITTDDGIVMRNFGLGYEIMGGPLEMPGRTKIATQYYESKEGYRPQRFLEPTIQGEPIPTRTLYVLADSDRGYSYIIKEFDDTMEEYSKFADLLEIGEEELESTTRELMERFSGIPVSEYRNLANDTEDLHEYGRTDEDYKVEEVEADYSRKIVAYNTSLSPEINEKLLVAYFKGERCYEISPLLDVDFITTYMRDLINCFGGKEGLIDFVSRYPENLDQEKIEKMIQGIKDYKPYTVDDMREGLQPRAGELEEAMKLAVEATERSEVEAGRDNNDDPEQE